MLVGGRRIRPDVRDREVMVVLAAVEEDHPAWSLAADLQAKHVAVERLRALEMPHSEHQRD
jgi:hypothetical protein